MMAGAESNRLDRTIQPTPTEQQFSSFQRMFDYFNEELFAGSLAAVMLNLSRLTPRTLGFFAPDRWESETSRVRLSEISLNPSTLKNRSPEDIASTLVHEQVHLWQHQYGSPSRRGYHNRQWADRMGSIGLMPSSTGQPGGRRVGQSMSHYVVADGPFAQAFRRMPRKWFLPFTCGEPSNGRKAPKPRNKSRYSCPSCSTHVWGRPGIEAACLPCQAVFMPDSGLSSDDQRRAA